MADCSPKNCETLDETKYKGVGCEIVMEGGEAPAVTWRPSNSQSAM
jgi:hypothetical protein